MPSYGKSHIHKTVPPQAWYQKSDAVHIIMPTWTCWVQSHTGICCLHHQAARHARLLACQYTLYHRLAGYCLSWSSALHHSQPAYQTRLERINSHLAGPSPSGTLQEQTVGGGGESRLYKGKTAPEANNRAKAVGASCSINSVQTRGSMKSACTSTFEGHWNTYVPNYHSITMTSFPLRCRRQRSKAILLIDMMGNQ